MHTEAQAKTIELTTITSLETIKRNVYSRAEYTDCARQAFISIAN